LWADPVAAPVIRAVRSIEPNVPDEWSETWRLLPHIAAALDAPEPSVDVAEESDAMEEAMRRAGLADETILSPAQRRSRGLVRHRRSRRRPLVAVAAALGVVAIAAATSFAVAQLNDEDATATSLPAASNDTLPPTTQAIALEDTGIDVPIDLLFGTALDRGDVGRSGYFGVTGPREVDGYYWVFRAADAIASTPLAYGNNLLVGSSDGTYQAIDLTSGQSVWSLSAEDQIDASGALSIGSTTAGDEAAPALGGGGGDTGGTAIIVGDVRARDALVVTTTQTWSTPLGSSIKSSPVVVDGVVYVATTDGHVHALDLFNGDVLWRYPSEDGESAGRIIAGLAYADGYVYAGTEEGSLLLINPDGTLHCQSDLGAPIVVNPLVVDGKAYVSSGQIIHILPTGVCEVPVTEAVQFLSETVVDVAPAVVGDLIYIPNADFLNAVDLAAVESGVSSPEEAHHWSEGKVNADGKIASPPVVTDDAVYFGTETGTVYAVDSDTGDLLWDWTTGNYVRASPVVIDGAVYIASGDGNVYAIGPAS
jgi:outer membrane protein assembly factor BamB